MRARFLTLLLLVLALPATPASARKTDVIVMDNGNRLVAEIKKLEYGMLNLSMTDIKGRVEVEWAHVVRVTSEMQMDIENTDGVRFFGSLVDSGVDGVLRVRTVFGEFDIDRADVVNMEPIKASFAKRLVGDVATGISYTKSTEILQFNFGGSIRYRSTISVIEASLHSIITSSNDGKRTNTDFPVSYQRFLENRWFYRGDVGANRNDELGIDLRTSVAGGFGRRLVQSNSALARASLLLSANHEFTSDGNETNNLELVLDTSLMAFRYDTPKLEITIDGDGFLNLTSWGRYRVNLDGRISLEIIEDLFWDISQVYYRFDSDPSTTATSGTDWGVISGVRYKFD